MSVMAEQRHWWQSLPDVVPCPECGCPIQRKSGDGSTIRGGLRAHYKIVHPGVPLPITPGAAS